MWQQLADTVLWELFSRAPNHQATHPLLYLLAPKAICIFSATLEASQEDRTRESKWRKRLGPRHCPVLGSSVMAGVGTALPLAPWRGPAHRAQAAGELAQEIMLFQLCAGLVLVKQGELELLHFLEVVVKDELLGERGVEVVDRGFRPVILAEGQGDRTRGQAAGSRLLGLPGIILRTG